MKRAYCRCNGGDYFIGTHCPQDGWSSSASFELTEAVRRLDEQGREVSIAGLREAGVSEESLARIIVIEFGSAASAFEALTPEGYGINGRWVPLRDAGLDFS